MIRLIIYDDDKDIRDSLAQFLEATNEFKVVAMFPNCDTIATDITELDADILIMDIDMPGTNGIDGVTIAKNIRPDLHVLMFTVFEDDEKIFDAICAGANGYLLKKTPPDKMIEALKDLHTGGAPITSSIAKKVLLAFPKKPKAEHEPLTEKEQEVLQYLVQGSSYKQVADIMKVSVETVRTHIRHIYAKLHVRSMSQAVAKAINQKIV